MATHFIDLIILHLELPVIRRSRESGNPEKSRRWIPAYAGMTGFSSFPILFLLIKAE
ncbi:hypothetical protein [Halothiobacillus neapolitanus]|uniref:hypothetical protein n=1 Tax=Halothiobacillus neapolitanus TaxID=927 RepID=UPI0002FC2FD6|nr:hypothetical protein [Halothiobacillus neapolitanus]TDN58314.1 hypothetical protein C8D83_10838 [Halothiobacillus neapolitanus]